MDVWGDFREEKKVEDPLTMDALPEDERIEISRKMKEHWQLLEERSRAAGAFAPTEAEIES